MFHTLDDAQISMNGIIKTGKIASVHECTIRNNSKNETFNAVSIKLNVKLASDQEFEIAKKRIIVHKDISKMSHDNILKFYGTWVEGDMLHLGFEMAEKGKMTEFLRQSRSQGKNMSSLSNYNIIKMLTDIAHGLSHLHQRNIIHGDLRGENLC